MPIAIDWGNSNTVVAYRASNQEHLFTQKASALIPSFVQYDDEGRLLSIGLEARNALATNQGHVVAGIKRLIGVSYSQRVARWAKRVYGLSLLDDNGHIAIEVGDVTKSPEQIATEFFQKLRELLAAEVARAAGLLDHILGRHRVKDCVVTCPAHYNEAQITSLRRCVSEADLVLLNDRLVPEPQAAGQLLAETFKATNHETILVVDWGGGTLDFAVIKSDGQCEYLSAAQEDCGGIDMDRAILEGLDNKDNKKKGILFGLSEHDRAVARLLVEQRKEELLSGDKPTPPTPLHLQTEGRTLDLSFSREELVQWIEPILDQALNGVEGVLSDTRSSQVKQCVLIGGPVRSPFIVEQIRKSVGRTPVTIFPDPMTAVARGALRGVTTGETKGIIPHDYGVMVDLLGHHMGLLLLRSQTPCPVQSEVREMKLRGIPGQPVQLAVWARKVDLAREAIEYESSTAFTFLPRFDGDAHARIRVSLLGDASGVITARVLDVATNQQINLNRVGSAISCQVAGPPCRSLVEVNGLMMCHVWEKYLGQTMFGAGSFPWLSNQSNICVPDDPAACEQFIKIALDIPPDGPVPPKEHEPNLPELWKEACEMAEHSLHRAAAQNSAGSALTGNEQELREKMKTPPDAITETAIRDLLQSAGRLHSTMVRTSGTDDVMPRLKACEKCQSDTELARKVNLLAELFRNFNPNQYERLMACWAEIRADLAVSQAGEDVLDAFNPVMDLVQIRFRAMAVLFHLDSLRRTD